ncbi:MAG: hypothetical protein IPN86_22990 [Saprospiraceae bacterium]|nr:hypothetical protein [Saprospiraceae bacterium]
MKKTKSCWIICASDSMLSLRKRMKTDLEILIEHLQAEFDYLKSSLDECISEWDFDGAEAFRKPVIYTRRKLDVLKCLENPNYNKISRLTSVISKMEKSLDEKKYDLDFLDEQTRLNMEQHLNESTRQRIDKSKLELEGLKTFSPKQQMDNDKILELLEGLERNEIKEIEFEIKKDEIFLLLRVDEQYGEFSLRATDNKKVEHYLVEPTKSILRQLGFDTETFKLQISNFTEMDKLRLLEKLAILYFEVFGAFGKDINLKIE